MREKNVRKFNPPLYLDYAASTPVDPRVLEDMLPFLSGDYGNPSSPHAFGRKVRSAIDLARDRVARLLHTEPGEICFTSGGSESDNLALFGAAFNAPPERRRVVVSAIEHHAVLNSSLRLREMGYDVRRIPVLNNGELNLNAAAEMIDASTAIVSVMLVNNETGAVLPVKKIAGMAHNAGALMHTDAVQAAGLLRVDPRSLGVDLLSLSAHKLYGPLGAGALWVRRGVKLVPVIHGGAQERERRAGTENAAGLVGFGASAEIAQKERQQTLAAVTAAKDAFSEVFDNGREIELHASRSPRVPSILNYAVHGVDAELLLMRLDTQGIAISTGSACASGSMELSHVLLAMGIPASETRSSIRISFGRMSDVSLCKTAALMMLETIEEMRDQADY